MTAAAPPRSLLDLLLLSDFGRANPERARELLDRAAASRESASDTPAEECDAEAA